MLKSFTRHRPFSAWHQRMTDWCVPNPKPKLQSLSFWMRFCHFGEVYTCIKGLRI
ncbi:hypothetical protein ZOSMA_68G00630 [Zostera marina]|uniref:Uncharacterized protein n=1 Tax=Zostera marina TaxID=29655 RepID=A0A0K9NTT6_ZOSMR|nr:hypothetical protein ZOSMA_68G00630 [Zostera marina]